tara:strand:+ start:5003 stop:5113 length:111 start_codon:yes stop_codon:yes gene_type:complete
MIFMVLVLLKVNVLGYVALIYQIYKIKKVKLFLKIT